MGNFLMVLAVAINLVAGYWPTETNNVDPISMFNFCVAVFAAYAWGFTSK